MVKFTAPQRSKRFSTNKNRGMEVLAHSYNTNSIAVILKGAVNENRQAVHLVFLIDVSDSMQSNNKLDSVKRSIEFLLTLLQAKDMVSLITFGEDSETVAKGIQMDSEGKAKVSSVIRSLKTNGCTNMSSALLSVADLYKENPVFWGSPGHKHGVLLLTDGHANRGVSTVDGLLTITAKLLQENPTLSISTVGYGVDHNSSLLKDIATSGTGSYNVVNDLEGIATTFGEILGGLTTVVAQNVIIKYTNGFTPKTSYGVSENRIVIGDIYSEQEIIILGDKTDDTLSFTVSGYDMRTLEKISVTLSPTPINNVTKPIELAEFRYKVSSLLKTPNKEVAETLLTQLRALSYASENLVQMMIEDCETVLETLERGRSRESEVEMAQHSAYLGLGRGMRSLPMRPQTPPTGSRMLRASPNIWGSTAGFACQAVADPGDPQPLSRRRTAQVNYASSPFSNQTQSATVTYMRECSAQNNTNMEEVD